MEMLLLLDAGLVGLACSEPRSPDAIAFDGWLKRVVGSSVNVSIADVTRYEVRRELVRLGATAKLRRLESLCLSTAVIAITSEAWERAGDFWAIVRQGGKPTAAPEALDADAILAGVAATMGGPEDRVMIATTNVRHPRWFSGIDAQCWRDIPPEVQSV